MKYTIIQFQDKRENPTKVYIKGSDLFKWAMKERQCGRVHGLIMVLQNENGELSYA